MNQMAESRTLHLKHQNGTLYIAQCTLYIVGIMRLHRTVHSVYSRVLFQVVTDLFQAGAS